ncbi:glyoxysomal fatty acid beta-oxidation multifunctional protein MFP-a-like isoform X1 [Solanum tuberosum]|uniref:glyoxysomal fatty acid beta-oxidation multifunctional protein MFP-a-like isoform X1 n=1 Tax=Solanum tuberosum TaxID=4113 RepID=UPI0003D28D85|nr:PREDICTED: glyoxysomal fatty acid beta-oxidation multifunctional protein MFP-a-like isoform X1 [Solanum tuberosum]
MENQQRTNDGKSPDRKILSEVGENGVAIITINRPPLNLLSVDVLLSLKEKIEEAIRKDSVKAIVITGSRGNFSAGFVVTAFGGSQQRKTHRELGFMSVDFITDTLEASRKPIVAAVEGFSLGGGFEIALACHARISTSTSKLGLPELQYGILPGFGGTQRLPRLVGLPKALEMILMSKRISGDEACNMCLVDAISPSDQLLGSACQWALDILECRRPWSISLFRTDRLAPLAEARTLLNSVRAQIQKQNPNVIHPLVCIDVIEHGILCGPRNGLWKEAEALHELRQSDSCRSLVHVFFAKQSTSKIPGITDIGLLPRKINKVAILGGSLMSSGIATVLVLANYYVIMKYIDQNSLQNGIGRVKANLEGRVKEGRMTQEHYKKACTLLKGVLSYDNFKDVDLVIEDVPDIVSLKQQYFADLDECCPPHCIFASTTCIVNLDLIGEGMKPCREIVGIHFFSSPSVTDLLEIVRTERTSPQTLVDLLNFGRRIQKTPIVVQNCTGFVVRRMCFPYLQAAMLLVEHGADAYQIDKALTSFGLKLGPFRMLDQDGFQSAAVHDVKFLETFPDRSYKSNLIPIMRKNNRAGKYTCQGFYTYNDKEEASPDPEISKYIEMARSMSGITIKSKLATLSDGEIVEMILFPVLNEACRMISEAIIVKSSDLDVASVLGMGFPGYRGGIIFWSHSVGSKDICSKLEEWSKEYGEFFKPCAYLVERASKRSSLGAQVKQAKSLL